MQKRQIEINMPGAPSIYVHLRHLQFYKIFPCVLLHRKTLVTHNKMCPLFIIDKQIMHMLP